jgi:hypothetical protein
LNCPPKADIPDYSEARSPFEIAVPGINREFYRDVAECARVHLLVQPLSLAISNTGDTTAQDVRVVIEVGDPGGKLTFMEKSDLPEWPKKQQDFMPKWTLADQLRRKDELISIEKVAETWRIECRFDKVQPKATVRLPADLYVGAIESMNLALEIRIFADNLSHPVITPSVLHIAAETHAASLEEIKKLNFRRFKEARDALAARAPTQ